jgi:16S rRNA (uracil1498-N3)-methyltransferase
MADRYFVETPIQGPSARLEGGEAHHLAHVMRARPGHEVVLFDGSGAEFVARVEHVGRGEVELAVVSRAAVDRELAVPVVLGVALPKGDRQRWLMEKATELGVARLVPLVAERSQLGPSPGALEKLRRAVIEASKQCGRNRLMEITEPQPLAQFLATADDRHARLICHPGGQSFAEALAALMAPGAVPPSIHLAIGPEGGFTEMEAEQAQARGWQLIDLGPRVLRVETAAVGLAAAIAFRLQHDAR